MQAATDAVADDVGFGRRPAWIVVLLALAAGQAATTLTLFGPQRSWRPLVDARPVTSGRHALHFYHGTLGAHSWRRGHYGACYDPAFQAGYPKTPVFDSGSRPAELFLLIGGSRPAAYKLGLAACCIAVPIVFAGGARLLRLGPGTSCLTAAFAQVAWWSGPVQQLLKAGQLDWLLAGLIVFLHAALLARYHQSGGGLAVWFGLLLTSIFGWFCHPILWLGFAVLFVPFYLAVALRHGGIWNLALWGAWCGGFAANLGWLADWLKFCWISLPISTATSDSLPRLADWWASDIWGAPHDRLLTILMVAGGMIGVVAMIRTGKHCQGMMLGASALLLPLLSAGSSYWTPLEHIGVAKLLVLGVGFAAAPCAFAIIAGLIALHRIVRHPLGTAAVALCLVVGFLIPLRHQFRTLLEQCAHARSLSLGLSEEQEQLIQTIRASTSRDARILIEDRENVRWMPLLADRSERAFLGGLDPDPGVEHFFARLTPPLLAGRPLTDWTDAELDRFCWRYNVSNVICWSPDAVTRFHNWSGCEPAIPVREHGDGWLFTIQREPSFVLKGKARITRMDAERIALNDVEPEEGMLLLSLHYQDGWRVSPSHIEIEPEPDAYDPIPLMRLRMKNRATRVTLEWVGK